MKSTSSCLAVAGLLVLLGGTGLAFALPGDPEDNYVQLANAQEAKEGDTQAGDEQAEEADEGAPAPSRRGALSRPQIVAKLGKLQASMKERLDLTPEQTRTIDSLFEEHVQSLKESTDRRARHEEQEGGLEEVRQLREQLVEARKAGDKERAQEIRQQMSEKLRQRRSTMPMPTGHFLEKVANELEENQVSTFNALVKRFDLDQMRRPRRNPWGNLMRAVMSPELNLSREQRQAIREVMREQMSSMRSGDLTAEQEKEVFARLQ